MTMPLTKKAGVLQICCMIVIAAAVGVATYAMIDGRLFFVLINIGLIAANCFLISIQEGVIRQSGGKHSPLGFLKWLVTP